MPTKQTATRIRQTPVRRKEAATTRIYLHDADHHGILLNHKNFLGALMAGTVNEIQLSIQSQRRVFDRFSESNRNLLIENTRLANENLFLKSIIAIAGIAIVMSLCVAGFVS
jgi:hypothetical protein